LGLAKRSEIGIKVRQPLAKLIIKAFYVTAKESLNDEYLKLIKDEVNVKEVEFIHDKNEMDIKVELDTTMTPELIAEGLKRELVRFINAERKNADLTINDRIILHYKTDSQSLKRMIKKYGVDLKKDVLADEVIEGVAEGGKEIDVNGEKIILNMKKV